MEKRPYRQLLGLPRTETDSAYIKKYSIVRSQESGLDAVCLALQYCHHFGYNNTTLSERYNLRCATFTDIEEGVTIKRNWNVYLHMLVMALNDKRLTLIMRGETEEAGRIMMALGEIGLVLAGVATDAEMAEECQERENEKWREKARREGWCVPRK